MKKLRWINGQHLRALPSSELADLISEQFVREGVLASEAPDFALAAAKMVAEKVELVNDAQELVRDAMAYPLADTLKSDAAQPLLADVADVGRAVLAAYKAGELPDPSADDFPGAWKAWSKAVGKELGRKGKGLFMPLRIVTTGRMAGPDIPAQLALLSLASEPVQLEATQLADRMAILEKELSELPVAQPA